MNKQSVISAALFVSLLFISCSNKKNMNVVEVHEFPPVAMDPSDILVMFTMKKDTFESLNYFLLIKVVYLIY